MSKAVQSSPIRPTNKLITHAATAAAVSVLGRFLAQYAPILNTPEVLTLASICVGVVVAWFVKDAPNVEIK